MNEAEIRANIATINDNIKSITETLSLYPPLPHCNPEQRVDRLRYEERLDKEKEDLREEKRRLDKRSGTLSTLDIGGEDLILQNNMPGNLYLRSPFSFRGIVLFLFSN